MAEKKKIQFPKELLFSNDILAAIGLIFTVTATIEHVLQVQLVRMLMHASAATTFDPGHLILTVGMEAKAKTSLVRTVASSMSLTTEQYKRICKCCDRIDTALNARNWFAHGYIEEHSPGGDTITLHRIQHKRGSVFPQAMRFNAAEIGQKAIDIHQTVGELVFALDEIGFRPIPLDKPLQVSPEPTPEPESQKTEDEERGS